MNDISELFVFPEIKNFSFKMILSKPTLGLIFVFYFIIYVILSSILFYHWTAYGMKSRGVILTETIFLFVSLVLFVFAGLAISYY